MTFSKKMQGTISVFLVLILLPMFVLTAVLIDGTIILGAKNIVNDAGELAMGGALAHYDEKLLDYYGLIATDTKVNLESKAKSYFSNSLSSESASTYLGFSVGGGSFIKMKDEGTSLSTVDNTEIWQPYVMESEMLQFMKYRAPVLLLESNKLSALKEFKDVKAQTECIKKELDFEDEVADIQDLLNSLHSDLKENYVEKKYPEAYKDNDITGKWQEDMHSKFYELTSYYVARRGIESHFAPGEANFEDSISAAKEVVRLAKDLNSSPENFEVINDIRDARCFVIDLDFTNGLEEGTSEYDEMWQLKEDFDDAWSKAESVADGLLDTTDQMEKEAKKEATKYYDETSELYELFSRSEKTCKKIEDKLKSAKDERKKWGDSIKDIKDDEKRAEFQELYDKWTPLFGDLEGSASDLSVLKDNMKQCKEYMEEMLKYMEEMKFCDISYPASGKNNNWNVISGKADGFPVTNKAEYDSAVNAIRNTFVRNDNSPSGKIYDVFHDNFYRNMDNEPDGLCCQRPNESGKSEDEVKEDFKDIQKAQKDQEAEKNAVDESLNKRLGESLAGKDIPSNHNGIASAGVNTDNDSGRSELSSVEDPVKDKKKAKNSGEKMLNGTGDIIGNLSTGARSILSNGFESIFESAYEATYITEMLSNRTSGIGDKDAESLKGKDMKNNYLFQGEAEYVLWGDKVPRKDIKYNENTIFTIRYALNTISAFTNPKLRHEAELMATGIGAVFPLSIPLITNLIILACSLSETFTDQNYLIVKGKDIVLFHTVDTWCCYPFNPTGAGINKDDRTTKGLTKVGYSDYTWLFLFATLFGDGAMSESKLIRTADCIQLNMTEPVTGIGGNSIMKEYTMVQMNSEVELSTHFLKNARSFVGQNNGSSSDVKFYIKYNSAQGY